jgi:ribonuclease P protein component
MTVSETAPNGKAVPSKRFPRSGRLLRHSDFERVYKQGRRHFSSHMTVFYLRRDNEQGLRIGFTVSRALGGAVDRNRMKRRLREAARKSWPTQDLPVDVVVNPKKSVLTADFGELLNEMSGAFQVVQKKISAGSGSGRISGSSNG